MRRLTNAQLPQEGRLGLVLEAECDHQHIAGQALPAGQQQAVLLDLRHSLHPAGDMPRACHLEDGVTGLPCSACQSAVLDVKPHRVTWPLIWIPYSIVAHPAHVMSTGLVRSTIITNSHADTTSALRCCRRQPPCRVE